MRSFFLAHGFLARATLPIGGVVQNVCSVIQSRRELRFLPFSYPVPGRVLGSFLNCPINPDNSSARRLESLKNIFKLTELHKWQIPESYRYPGVGYSRLFFGHPPEGASKAASSLGGHPASKTCKVQRHLEVIQSQSPSDAYMPKAAFLVGLSQTYLESLHFWSVTLPQIFSFSDCPTLNLSLLLNKIWPQEDAINT